MYEDTVLIRLSPLPMDHKESIFSKFQSARWKACTLNSYTPFGMPNSVWLISPVCPSPMVSKSLLRPSFSASKSVIVHPFTPSVNDGLVMNSVTLVPSPMSECCADWVSRSILEIISPNSSVV